MQFLATCLKAPRPRADSGVRGNAARGSERRATEEWGNGGQGGFTLIEMIVVLVIMGLVAGLVMVKQPWHSAGLNTDATVRALTNALRLARSRAIAQDRMVAVDTGASGFSVDGGAAWLLPQQEFLSASRVVFTPDGGSTGGTILLAAGARRIAVDVNWLTGRVRAREAAAQ